MTVGPVYRVLGTTDDVTDCGVCGRSELKGTIVLDLDGDIIYAGSDCGSRLVGKPAREVRADAKAGDRAARDAADAVRRAEGAAVWEAYLVGFRAWMLTAHGLSIGTLGDIADMRPKLGRSPISYEKEYAESRGLTGLGRTP